MMKKILLFSALVTMLASCGEDDPKSVVNTGPSTPVQEYNALLLMGSDITNPSSATYEEARIQALDVYGDRLNTLHMVSGIAYPAYADSIMMNFQSPASPYFVLGNTEVFPLDLISETKIALREKPLLALSNKVTQNDTAWVIDHKVKFFMDTVTTDIYIDTYMLGRSKARKYSTNKIGTTYDIRMAATQKLIKNPAVPLPPESQWDKNIVSDDLTKILVNKGESFYYENQFVDKFDSTSAWGFSLGNYWPFGGEFFKGDIIGTNDTPIRHYFKKFNSLNAASPDYVTNTEYTFMSIVWMRDPVTGSFVYVNSYMNPTVFTVN